MVIWLPGCLVGLVSASEILGLLGLYKVRSGWVVVEFGLSAMWSGYSWVYISCATVISFQYPTLRAWGDISESKQQSLPLESLREFR